MVPVVGLEPTRCCQQRILSPSRLPFRHTGTLPTAYILPNIYFYVNIKNYKTGAIKIIYYNHKLISKCLKFTISIFGSPKTIA